MSAVAILPYVWAAHRLEIPLRQSTNLQDEADAPEMAFYRKYTEGILRRYVRLSMEAGKVPSLLGQEMFRAKVTSYRVESFEDVVIFVHDVEQCLAKLDEEQQRLIARISLQQYTVSETATLLDMKPRTVVRRYHQSVDRLTRIFLNVKMLEPMKCCQEGRMPF